MLRNYLTTTLRHSLRQKLYTFINLSGLALGLAVCLLVGLYVAFETSYDQPLTHVWRLYVENYENGGLSVKDGNTHSAAGRTLKAEVPEIEEFARVFNHGEQDFAIVANHRPLVQKQVFMVDPAFLQLFDCKVLAGNARTALAEPYTALLTRATAQKLFGSQAVIGKNLRFSGGFFEGNYTITGLVEDVPANTHLKYQILLSFQTRYAKGLQDNWENYWEYTYLKLRADADPALVKRKVQQVAAKHLKNPSLGLNIQYAPDIHLHSDLTYEIEAKNQVQVVYFWIVIAIFILAIACLNYINLATAKSFLRAKEVALRKAIGASRWQVMQQFLLEAVFYNVVAWGLALGLADLGLPYFAQLMNRPLSWAILDGYYWVFPLLFVAGVLASGFYPSFVLSAFRPLAIFQQKASPRQARLRQGLIVLQFVISILLISGTVLVLEQVQFLRKHDAGLNLDQMLVVKAPQYDWRQDSLYRQKFEVFRNSLAAVSQIEQITASSVVSGAGLATIGGTTSGVQWANGNVKVTSAVYFMDVAEGFFGTYGIRRLAGTTAAQFARDSGQSPEVMINRAALKKLGFPSADQAVGEHLFFANNRDNRVRIAGVVENFAIQSLKTSPNPTIYYVKPAGSLDYYSFKINQLAPVDQWLPQVETAWKSLYPEQPMQYFWLAEKYDEQYADEKRMGQLFSLAAGLAILLSCSGLLGLATFMAERRVKEVGIRKVLGANVLQITTLLSKDFLKLVMLAFVIASPIAYYFMDKWLADFAYRITISWWVFALSGAAAVLIALLTVSWQSIRAALANPVKSLRSE